jgi:lipoprotein-anchoring transpeptidase ErfK/SrfK
MKRFLRGLAGGLLIALAAPGAPNVPASNPGTAPDAAAAPGSLSIKVDLSDRRLDVLERGKVIRTHRIAVGHPKWPTPSGHFRIHRIVWNPSWTPPDASWARREQPRAPGDPENPMGRVKIFFREPSYYIHGTREYDSLGRAESHGCIRMRNSEAVSLARLIMQNGGASRPQGWWRRVLNRVRNTQEVYLSRSIPVVIQR